MATALTVRNAFTLDSVRYMLNVQFGISQREDVQITRAADLHDETVPEGRLGRKLVAEPTSLALKPGTWTIPVKVLIKEKTIGVVMFEADNTH